jgi:hypothetical protein
VNPVAGAIVSTSLDNRTATTDAAGHFDLVTAAGQHECEPYTLTITASGHPRYSKTWRQGGKNMGQTFVLAKGDPAPPPCEP